MRREQELDENEGQVLAEADHQAEPNPFLVFYNNPGSVTITNEDILINQYTCLEGFYIVPENNVKRFYHRLIQPHRKTDLYLELEWLRQNHYATIVDVIADFISKRKGLSVFSFNCQSLRSHFNDLNDQVTQRANILIRSETWFENEQEQSIPNQCQVNPHGNEIYMRLLATKVYFGVI